jgi:hypothetical protein
MSLQGCVQLCAQREKRIGGHTWLDACDGADWLSRTSSVQLTCAWRRPQDTRLRRVSCHRWRGCVPTGTPGHDASAAAAPWTGRQTRAASGRSSVDRTPPSLRQKTGIGMRCSSWSTISCRHPMLAVSRRRKRKRSGRWRPSAAQRWPLLSQPLESLEIVFREGERLCHLHESDRISHIPM